ncbi:MAG: hypothetical protein HKN27_10700 [Silicimonas sp.]|nr:hypothetical protein [Silicimonas sp.]
MNKPLKVSLTAVLLWSVAVVPATTITFMATADAAHAKSDNAGGKGNGGGNSGKSNSGKSANAGGKTSATTSSGSVAKGKSDTARSNGSDPVGKMVDRLLGRDKAKMVRTKTTTRKVAAKRSTVVAKSQKPASRPEKGPMHPSNLGNMNGALNANVNAVLAHIKNGNTNGPVGHLAALAVANVNAEGAQEIIDLKEDFVDLQEALDGTPYETVAEYYEALDGVEPIVIEDIDNKIAALDDAVASQDALDAALADSPYATEEDYLDAVAGGADPIPAVDSAISNLMDPVVAQDELDMALSDNGYEGDTALADYEVDREGVEGIEEIAEVSDAIGALGGDVEARTDITEEEPSDEAVAGAEDDIAAQTDAEIAILDYWNKNEDADPEITEEEQALLDKLNERLAAEEEAIKAAVGTDEPDVMDEESDGEDVAQCDDGDESCAPEDEIAAVVE